MQQKLTTEIETASTRLNRVVQSLLSAARLQSGQVRPKWIGATSPISCA